MMTIRAWARVGIVGALAVFSASVAFADVVEPGPKPQMAYAIMGVGNSVIGWDCADECLKRKGDKCCQPTIIQPE